MDKNLLETSRVSGQVGNELSEIVSKLRDSLIERGVRGHTADIILMNAIAYQLSFMATLVVCQLKGEVDEASAKKISDVIQEDAFNMVKDLLAKHSGQQICYIREPKD